MAAEGAYEMMIASQAGSGRAARRTSTGTPARPGEVTTISRLIPMRCPLSGSSRCCARDSASGPALPLVVSRFERGAEVAGEILLILRPGRVLSGAGEADPDRVTGTAEQAGPMVRAGVDPTDEYCPLRDGLAGLFERGRSAGQGAVLVLELAIEFEQLAADLARLLPESVEGLLLLLGQRPGLEHPVDPLVDGLAAAEQGGLAIALVVGERSGGPPGHLVDDAAGQATLPALPGVARPAGAGQGGGEAGEG